MYRVVVEVDVFGIETEVLAWVGVGAGVVVKAGA